MQREDADPLVGYNYSLLAPRPFRPRHQYQSVSSLTGSSLTPSTEAVASAQNPFPQSFLEQHQSNPVADSSIAQYETTRSGSPGYFGDDNALFRLGLTNLPSPLLMPQEPAEWGFFGSTPSPHSPSPAVGGTGNERIIPIKVVYSASSAAPVESVADTSFPGFRSGGIAPDHMNDFDNSFLNQPYQPPLVPRIRNLSADQHQEPQWHYDTPQFDRSFLNNRENTTGFGGRIIPIRIESSGSNRQQRSEPAVGQLENLKSAPFVDTPFSIKSVRFADREQHRLISPISPSPVEERSVPIRVENTFVPPISKPKSLASEMNITNSNKNEFTILSRPIAASSGSQYLSSQNQQNQRLSMNSLAPLENMEPPPSVKVFDATIMEGPLDEFVRLSAKIGGDVNTIGASTKEAFQALRVFLWKSAGMPKPNDNEMQAMQKPISEKMEAIQAMKSTHRASQFLNHLSAIGEGITALCWINIAPTPAPYIKEMSDASQFYTNRVLKDYKEVDKTHVDWVKAWLQTLSEMQQYVKQNHTTGLVWNSSPGTAPAGGVNTGGGVPPPPSMSGLPPPPPPPPPPADFMKNTSEAGGGDVRAALFADINKGLDITKALKKVTADMQTHKNPTLRDSPPQIPPKPSHLSNGGGGGGAISKSVAAKTAPTAAPERAPVLECEGGKKWLVEHHKGNKNIRVEVADMKQVIYIYKCVDCVIQIKGKANSITMDSCKKTNIVFDSLVSSIEIINCQSVQVQTLGAMPTLAIQKTDGCQVYLSREARESEIVTSKSSEMNILVPDDSGEFKEFPVPEQYKTVFDGKKLFTQVVDIA